MKDPVLTKSDMYVRRDRGDFGNTLSRFVSYDSWRADSARYRLWGVQHTKIAGFPGTRLDVEATAVETVVRENFGGVDYCISPMIHQVGTVLWEGDVTESYCSGNYSPAPGSWRRHMLHPRLWEGSAARVLLRSLMNENSFDDLTILLETYPDHVVELSILDCCFGTVPGRNAIVWEVRKY